MTAAERLTEMLHMGPGQGVVVHDPSNIFYLTEGYTGEGMVYISAQKRVIITDFRYTEQARLPASRQWRSAAERTIINGCLSLYMLTA